ncbi:MAG: AAA family ATPase, partial [Elusimicrobiota bacterium]
MHFKKKDLINRIKERKAKLVLVAKKLKRHFVGIDDVIDSIMKNIEVWYVMPEIMTRPAIVNLWGMTGVGKTDLVRRLVSALGFQDRFVEVQLTNKGASNIYDRMIEQVLNCSGISHDQQGVLLLDEIQRFRSVDEEGHEIHDYRFQDVWQLLSDGKFSGCSRRKQELIEMIFSNLYYEDLKKAEENDDSDGEGLDMPNDEISITKNTLVT